MLCSHWQSSHHTYEENIPYRVFNCSLLSSCIFKYIGNTSHPTITNSGNRFCLPDPFKRRPCRPACPASRKYCHGRCFHGGRACLFATCSRSPYREDAGSTCSQLAMEQSQEGNCTIQCCNLSTATACQQCIEENIPDSCTELSGSSCWYCGASVLEKWRECSKSVLSVVDTINCMKQDIITSCKKCICTLLCYWSAEGDLCRSCLHQQEFATLFLHHQQCPQGWVYSSSSSMCLKAFTVSKIWSYASRFCHNGGGLLVQPESHMSIHKVIEAINLQAANEEYWIGGKEKVDISGAGISIFQGLKTVGLGKKHNPGKRRGGETVFQWASDDSVIETDNWGVGYPLPGLVTFFG